MVDIVSRSFHNPTALKSGQFPFDTISIFEARPKDPAEVRGGIVLIQEIFGVNAHIRSVATRFAQRGYAVWTPAFFDHVEKNVELGYDDHGMKTGRELVMKIGWDQPLKDVEYAASGLRKSLPDGNQSVTAIGFCWGGSLAYLCASRLGKPSIDAAVGYYGRQIHQFRSEVPRVPVLLHYGERDQAIPKSEVEEVKKSRPEIRIHTYDAGHGFNCDARKDFDAPSAELAQARTLEFLKSVEKTASS